MPAPRPPFVLHGAPVDPMERMHVQHLAHHEDPTVVYKGSGEQSPRSQEGYAAALDREYQLRSIHGGLPDSSAQDPVRGPGTVAKFR